MMKRPIINTLVQVGGKVVMVLMSLVTTAMLTRKLGTEIYGNYMLITSVLLLFDSLADFGSKVIGVREASGVKGEERKAIYVQVAWFRLVSSLLAGLLGLGVILFWSGFEEIRLEALVALVMIVFTITAGSLEVVFQTEMKMGQKVIMDILFPLFFLIVLFFWRNPINLMWVVTVYLVARIVSLGCGIKVVRGMLGKFNLKVKNKCFWKSFLKESWPMGIYMILFSGYDRAVDSAMIKQFMGAEQLAYYALSYKIYGNLVQPAYFLVNSIFPMMSDKVTNKKSLFWKSAGLMLVGGVLVFALIFVLAPWIIKILAGDSFFASVGVLRILLVAMLFAYISHLVGFTIIAKGGQRQILLIGVVSLVINVVGNLVTIPSFGIMGAAWTTVLTEAVASVLMIIALIKP